MRRRVINFCTGASLLVFTTFALLWPISYQQAFDVRWHLDESVPSQERYRTKAATLQHGRLVIEWDDVSIGRIGLSTLSLAQTTRLPRQFGPYRLGNFSAASYPSFPWYDWRYGDAMVFPDGTGNLLGISASRFGPRNGQFKAALPLSYLTAASGILSAWLVRRGWRLRRALAGPHRHCTGCGYDLRATPDRCPECGRAAA